MRIGIDGRMFISGKTGIGTYIKNLTDNIFDIDKNNEYIIFLLDPQYSNYEIKFPNVRKKLAASSWYSWKEQLTLPFDFWQENLDLMHFPHFNTPILYRSKNIATIHDIIPKFFPGHKMNSFIRRKCFDLTFSQTLKKADKIIAVSERTKSDLANYFSVNKDKINVIYEGVDSDFRVIRKEDLEKNDIRKKYNINKPYILYVGVWRNHKNVVKLLKAFDLLVNKYKFDLQLVIGGEEDPYYPEVRETWKELNLQNRVVAPGLIPQKELPYFYNLAECFVFPSLYEGFGLVGLEAMACGAPVASSNRGSLLEVLGSAANFFDPMSCEDMAEKIKEILENDVLKKNLIQRGFEQVKKYNWKKCAQETLKVYKEVGKAK